MEVIMRGNNGGRGVRRTNSGGKKKKVYVRVKGGGRMIKRTEMGGSGGKEWF